mgnify:CR=1 FL=1
MDNQLNSGSIDTLKKNDTLMVSARKVNGGKISLEFAEIIETTDRLVSALTILNKSGEMLDFDILNPTYQEQRFRVQINETVEGTQWQINNADVAAKRRGKGGDFITNNGEYIYSNGDIVLANVGDKVEHTYLTADTETIESAQKVVKEEAVEKLNFL